VNSLLFGAHLDLNPLIQGWEILSWSVDAAGQEITVLLVENVPMVHQMRYNLGACLGYNARLLRAGEHYNWELSLPGCTCLAS
jgi:hypothetical protein